VRHLSFDLLCVLSTAAMFAVGMLALRAAARRGPVGAGSVVAAGVLMGGAAFVGTFVILSLGLTNVFGAIRVLYLAGVVALPLVAIALLAARAAGRVATTRAALVLGCAGVVPAAVGAWATFVEPYRLQVETATVPVPQRRTGTEPVRVAVLADLQCDHVGAFEHEVIDRLMAERPDLILIPGDLFQGQADDWDRETPALHDLLVRLDAPGGVWFVVGDVDREARLPPVLGGTKIRVLMDEVARTRVRGRDITIGGVSHDERSREVAERLEFTPGTDDIRILLGHHPDVAFDLTRDSRVDLVVAGHTHGGQIVVPGFGPLMTLTNVPRAVAAGGLHRIAGNAIYVSRGVGMERRPAPRMRLFCPPEISVLTLSAGQPDAP
jgi:predicted MPP superfamily phosphohydrolase